MRRRRIALAVAGAASLLLVGATATPAAAGDDPNWYFSAFHIQDAWDAGYTGRGVTIGIIDTPIDPDLPALAGADLTVHEPSFCDDGTGTSAPATSDDPQQAWHGSNVAAYAIGTGAGYGDAPGPIGPAPDAALRYYTGAIPVPGAGADLFKNVSCDDSTGYPVELKGAIEQAIDDGVDILSISLGYTCNSDSSAAIARAHREGVIVIAALANGVYGQGEPIGFPACANGVVAVAAIGADASAQETLGNRNTYDRVSIANAGLGLVISGSSSSWSDASVGAGTSFAAPITAGFLAVAMQKYPDATSNQLLQSLVHNTGIPNPDLGWDSTYGYGIASLTGLLEVDPTTYPDVNPLLVDDPELNPSVAESLPGGAAVVKDELGVDANDPGEHASIVSPLWSILAVVGFVGLAVVAGLIVLIVVLTRRRPRADPIPQEGA